MIRLLIILAIILAVMGLPAYIRMSQSKRQRTNWLIIVGIGILLLMQALPGAIGLIIPMLAALIAGIVRVIPVLIRYAPLLHKIWFSWKQQQYTSQGDRTTRSIVETRFLKIQINAAGQPISGEVISGTFAGRQIDSMNSNELQQLFKECSTDNQSLVFLQQLIQQASGSRQYSGRYSGSHNQTGKPGKMSTQQACNVLGIKLNASRKEIITAHRRLIQKAHPDHGGSAELAAQINAARDALLK